MRQKNGSRKRDDIGLRQWKFPSVFLVLKNFQKIKSIWRIKMFFEMSQHDEKRLIYLKMPWRGAEEESYRMLK